MCTKTIIWKSNKWCMCFSYSFFCYLCCYECKYRFVCPGCLYLSFILNRNSLSTIYNKFTMKDSYKDQFIILFKHRIVIFLFFCIYTIFKEINFIAHQQGVIWVCECIVYVCVCGILGRLVYCSIDSLVLCSESNLWPPSEPIQDHRVALRLNESSSGKVFSAKIHSPLRYE